MKIIMKIDGDTYTLKRGKWTCDNPLTLNLNMLNDVGFGIGSHEFTTDAIMRNYPDAESLEDCF